VLFLHSSVTNRGQFQKVYCQTLPSGTSSSLLLSSDCYGARRRLFLRLCLTASSCASGDQYFNTCNTLRPKSVIYSLNAALKSHINGLDCTDTSAVATFCNSLVWVVRGHVELSNRLFLPCRRFASANRMLGQTFVCFAVSNSRNPESCVSVLPRLVR